MHSYPKLNFNLFLTKRATSLYRAVEILISSSCRKKNKIINQFSGDKSIFFSFWANQMLLKKKQKKKSSYFTVVFFSNKFIIKAETSNVGSETFYCMFIFWSSFSTHAFFFYYNSAMQFAVVNAFFVTKKQIKKTFKVFFSLSTIFHRKTIFFLTINFLIFIRIFLFLLFNLIPSFFYSLKRFSISCNNSLLSFSI